MLCTLFPLRQGSELVQAFFDESQEQIEMLAARIHNSIQRKLEKRMRQSHTENIRKRSSAKKNFIHSLSELTNNGTNDMIMQNIDSQLKIMAIAEAYARSD